jgi:hypothetical protein
MKRRVLILALAGFFIAALGQVDFAAAKQSSSGGGSRSSFSSGSSSRSPSSGSWSNSSGGSTAKSSGSSAPSPSAPGASGWSSSTSAPPPGPAGSSWSNSSGATAKSAAGAAGSSFATAGASGIRKQSSLDAYNSYGAKFGKPGNPTGGAGQPLLSPNRTWSSYPDYRRDRDRYYSDLGWRPPAYAYQSYPAFGFWDAMFLWMLLSHTGGNTFYYNNQNDPGVQAWRQEADKLAQSNDDLKKQLADMDAKIEQMRKDGVPVKAGAIPEGLDPSMAYAADTVVKETPEEPKAGSGWAGLAVVGVIGVAVGGLLILRKS